MKKESFFCIYKTSPNTIEPIKKKGYIYHFADWNFGVYNNGCKPWEGNPWVIIELSTGLKVADCYRLKHVHNIIDSGIIKWLNDHVNNPDDKHRDKYRDYQFLIEEAYEREKKLDNLCTRDL